MLYRPNYCCQCGEKIARARWTPLTSRRFCDFCEIEQKQHDLLPRAAFVLAVLFGAAGLTAYLGGNNSAPDVKPAPTAAASISESRTRDDGKVNLTASVNKIPPAENTAPANANATVANSMQRQAPPISSTETVYYCGAITKKGTPCTRRVKAKGRCWQHAGQPPISGSGN